MSKEAIINFEVESTSKFGKFLRKNVERNLGVPITLDNVFVLEIGESSNGTFDCKLIICKYK